MKNGTDKTRITHSSTRTVLMKALLMVLIPLLILSMVLSAESIEVTREQVHLTHANALKMNAGQVHDRLADVDSYVTALLLSDDVNALAIAKKDITVLYPLKQLNDRLRLQITGWQFPVSITMFFPGCPWVLSTQNGVESAEEYDDLDTWWASLSTLDHWCMDSDLRTRTNRCYTLTRGYVHAKQTSPVIRVEIDGDALLSMLNETVSSMHVTDYYLIDATDQWLAGSEPPEKLRQALALYRTEGTDMSALTLDGQRYYAFFTDLGSEGDVLGVLLEESRLLGRVIVLRNQMILILVLTVLVATVFYMVTGRRIVRPLQSLLDAMEEVGKGNLNVRVKACKDDDIGKMIRQFNRMVEQLQELIRNQYDKQIQLGEAQKKFLRSQINPHFLRNSLFLLYTLIQDQDIEAASNLTLYLGQYYQLTTHLEEQEAPLEREVEQIRLYIKIQQMRFQERLLYEEDIDPALMNTLIPSLSLMTLVENTMIHGMKCVHPVTLRISAHSVQNQTEITVEDDGAGMTEEQMAEIQGRLASSEEMSGPLHGIQNIWQRFLLHCHGRASIELQSRQPSGTLIRLTFSDTKGEDEHV